MNVALSLKIWKYILLAVNCAFSVATMFLISYGVHSFGCAGYQTTAYVAAAIGFFAMTVCFVGCFAALRESYIISCVFIGSIIAAIVSQTIFMIIFAAMKDDLVVATRVRVENKWEVERLNDPDAMHFIQSYYLCCGKDSPQDYLLDDDDVLPISCCRNNDCSIDANIHTKGCIDSAVAYFDEYSDTFILTILCNVVLEALGLVACFFFIKNLKQQKIKSDQAMAE